MTPPPSKTSGNRAQSPIEILPNLTQDVTGSQDGENQVCGVDINPATSEEIRHFLKPQVKLLDHPLFRNHDQLTAADHREAKKARAKGEEYLQEAQAILQKGSSPQDQQKALDKLQQAFPELLTALLKGENPDDKVLLLNVALVASQVGQVGMAKELYNIYLSEEPCNFGIRQQRQGINQSLLIALAATGEQIPEDQKSQATQMAQAAQQESQLDQGVLVGKATKILVGKIAEQTKGFQEKPAEDQIKTLEAVWPLIQELGELAKSQPQSEIYQKTFVEQPAPLHHKFLNSLMEMTAGSEDSQVQAYHDAFALAYHSDYGNKSYAVVLTRRIVGRVYRDLGNGDAKAGRAKVDEMLKKANEAKTEAEMKAAFETFSSLPPAFAEAHAFQLQLESFEELRQQGLLTLGAGNATQGRVQVNTFIHKSGELAQEAVKLQRAAAKLEKDGKKDEAQAKREEAQKKLAEGNKLGEALAQKFGKQEDFQAFMQAFMALDGFEKFQQSRLNEMALDIFKKYNKGVYEAGKDAEMSDSWGNSAAILFGSIVKAPAYLLGMNTPMENLSDENLVNMDVFYEVKKRLQSGEAGTVMEGLEQVSKVDTSKLEGDEQDRMEATVERAQELLTKEEDQFSLAEVLEYAASTKSDPIRAKALLARAQELKEKDANYVKTAWAIEKMVAETSDDPEVIKLAHAQMGLQKKAA